MILCIDTALDKCSIALCWENECVDQLTNEDSFKASEVLHMLIQKLLLKNNLDVKDLKAIAVNGGPGSYTGLRIGATTAKGLCYALNIPLIHIDGLRLLTQGVWELHKEQFKYYVPMIDARRMEVFTCIYDNNLNLVLPAQPKILTEEFLSDFNEEPIIVFGNGAEKASFTLQKKNTTFSDIFYNDTNHFKTLVWNKWLLTDFENNNTYVPSYLKKFYSNR